jgi:hypothetical protein
MARKTDTLRLLVVVITISLMVAACTSHDHAARADPLAGIPDHLALQGGRSISDVDLMSLNTIYRFDSCANVRRYVGVPLARLTRPPAGERPRCYTADGVKGRLAGVAYLPPHIEVDAPAGSALERGLVLVEREVLPGVRLRVPARPTNATRRYYATFPVHGTVGVVQPAASGFNASFDVPASGGGTLRTSVFASRRPRDVSRLLLSTTLGR